MNAKILKAAAGSLGIWVLSGCVSAPTAATHQEVKAQYIEEQKGDTHLSSAAARAKQNEIKESARLTQQTGDSQVVRVVKPRVFWRGVFREGLDKQWLASSLIRDLEPKFRSEVELAVANCHPTNLILKRTDAGDQIGDSDGLIVLLALSSEEQNYYRNPKSNESDQNVLMLRINGQLLFIDTKARRIMNRDTNEAGWQVTSSYPLSVLAKGLCVGKPTQVEWTDLAEMALLGTERTATGDPISIRDQFVDLLNSDAVAPRILTKTAPIAVSPVIVTIEDSAIQNGYKCDASELVLWADQVAASFARYLATNTGLAIRPYIAGGSDQINLSPMMSAAAQHGLEKGDSTILSASLQKPSEIFHLTIRLTASDLLANNARRARINYGFEAALNLAPAAVAAIGNPDLHWNFILPAPNSDPAPAILKQKYLQMIQVNLRRETLQAANFKHAYFWQDSLNQGLFQLTREMFSPIEDQANRFGFLRSHLAALGLLNLYIPAR